MRHYIIAKGSRQDTVYVIVSDLHPSKIKPAVIAAVQDFAAHGGLEAANALSACQGKLTWEAVGLWLPDAYARKHGFEVKDATTAVGYVSADENLLFPDTDAGKDRSTESEG